MCSDVCALVTPAFGRLEREDHEFKANLGLYSNSLNKEQNPHWPGEGGSDNLEEILAVPRLTRFFFSYSILLMPRLIILRNNNGTGKYYLNWPLQTSKQMQLLAQGWIYRDIFVTSACKKQTRGDRFFSISTCLLMALLWVSPAVDRSQVRTVYILIMLTHDTRITSWPIPKNIRSIP